MRTETPERITKPSQAATVPEVHRLQHLIVNSYLAGDPSSGNWAVIDAGLCSLSAAKILEAAGEIYGTDAKAGAILLTHGHFDHVGAVETLAGHWNVPVYAHPLELPYLTGRSPYPPPDPTVGGGLMARMAPFYPRKPIDLTGRIQALPSDGSVPALPGWRWIHTPGHSPGHVSFFRDADRALIAGDAFVTVKQESLLAVLTQAQEVHGPPMYYTPDWPAALQSVALLADLEPEFAATGHGIPMQGATLREQLRTLVDEFDRRMLPARGRYLQHPARTDEEGVVSLPPPVWNPVPKLVLGGLAAIAVAALLSKRRRRAA